MKIQHNSVYKKKQKTSVSNTVPSDEERRHCATDTLQRLAEHLQRSNSGCEHSWVVDNTF